MSVLQEIKLQVAAQDGQDEVLIFLSDEEVEELFSLTIEEIKSVYVAGIKRVDIIRKAA